MAFTVPAAADFKAFFDRDFPYGILISQVLDSDLKRAITEAGVNFSQSLWPTQTIFTTAYLYLSAHYLVLNLRASSQGIAGNYPWMTASKGVGSVNEGFAFPEQITKNAMFAMLSKTYYGAKYLELALPQLAGNIFTSFGNTKP